VVVSARHAIAPTDDPDAAGKDRRDLTKFCDETAPGVTDPPIDRISRRSSQRQGSGPRSTN
jgi:hypothetical protein